jgi:hypothetical protein
MDPLGLLLEIVAITVYPGGAFLAVLTWLTRRVGGMPAGTTLDGRGLMAIVAATLAAAMSAVPGAPAASLPPSGGATPNLIAALLLLFVAGALVAPHPWSMRRVAALGFGGLPLMLLGLAAASFSIAAVAGAGGDDAAVARILAVAAALIAMPLVVQPHLPAGSVMARATVVAATLEVLLSTLISPSLPSPEPAIAVAALVVAVALYALILRAGRAATRVEHLSLVGIAAACSAAATVAVVLAARP